MDAGGKAGVKTMEQPRFERLAIPQIDTIRVLAMLGVFSHHIWGAIIRHPEGYLERSLDVLFKAGSDGVVLFNILSGFLLALPYLGREGRPFAGYVHFLGRRLLRIIPPYYTALFLFSLGNILIFALPVYSALSALLLHLFFVNSFSYEMMATNFSPFWYLGMLAQFYLLFPLILRFFLRLGPARAALLIMVFCWGSWILLALWTKVGAVPNVGGDIFQFNLPGRLPEFAIGMWLASVWNPSARPVRGRVFDRPFSMFVLGMAFYAILAAPFLRTAILPLFHMFHVAVCVVFFMILFLWAPAAKVGHSGLMRRLSEASYCIYIVHVPIFSYVGLLPGSVPGTPANFFGCLTVLLALCYVVAAVVNRLAVLIVQRIRGEERYRPLPSFGGTGKSSG